MQLLRFKICARLRRSDFRYTTILFTRNFYDKICKNKGYSSDDATEGESDSDDDYTVDSSHFGNSVLEVAPVTSDVPSKCEKDHHEEESTVVESAIENKLSTAVMAKVDEIVSSHLCV